MENTPATTPRKKVYFRKRYLIDTKIQFPMIAYFVGLVIATFAIFTSFFLWGYSEYMDSLRAELTATQFSNVEMSLVDGRDAVITVLVFASVVSLLCSFVSGIFLSHKIAGPLYRLRKTLQQITLDKKPTNVKFRKGDYTQELGTDFNDAMNAISSNKT